MFKVAVLVLNYNGRKYLESFLNEASFLRDESDADLVVVDNASADRSLDFVRDRFPWVIIIRNDSNYGWGEGYNQGIRQLLALGESYSHYLFINNDVYPTWDWWVKLKSAALTSPSEVGEIGCRTVFAQPFANEALVTASIPNALDIGVTAFADNHHTQVTKYKNDNEIIYKVCVVPYQHELPPFVQSHIQRDKPPPYRWYLAELRNSNGKRAVDVSIPIGMKLEKVSLNKKATCWVMLKEPGTPATTQQLKANENVLILRWISSNDELETLVQNSGLGINKRFEGFDFHSYEPIATPQNHDDIAGICGVCKLVTKESYDKVGGFDPRYFMYYEDLDFSLRLRNCGFKFKLEDKAVLAHDHAGSSGVGSLFFRTQVAWSLLYFHLVHAGIWRRIVTWFSFRLRAWRESHDYCYHKTRVHQIALQNFSSRIGGNYVFRTKYKK
jgi:GT2 family glycosyltransferase